MVSRVQVCCGGTESNGRAYDQEPGKMCCGSDYVPRSSLCCKSTAGSWEVREYKKMFVSRVLSGIFKHHFANAEFLVYHW